MSQNPEKSSCRLEQVERESWAYQAAGARPHTTHKAQPIRDCRPDRAKNVKPVRGNLGMNLCGLDNMLKAQAIKGKKKNWKLDFFLKYTHIKKKTRREYL